MKHTYKTKGTCSNSISFELEGDVVKNISFSGGCNGNLKGISVIVDGMTVGEIRDKLMGIKCGFRSTSCPDQLAKAVVEAYESENG